RYRKKKCGERRTVCWREMDSNLQYRGRRPAFWSPRSRSGDRGNPTMSFASNGISRFFRDQDLTPDQHVAFAERFAPIDINHFFTAVPGYPMIAEVRKEPEQTRNIGGGWHTDHSYDQVPALGSMLYAREVPQTGGDTLFASMYSAYDALSDGLKQMLDGLRAC